MALAFQVPNPLSDCFYHFDQWLFDAGDFLIAVCLPFLAAGLGGFGWLRRKERLLATLAVVAFLVLLSSVVRYLLVDPLFEQHGLSVYGR